MLSQGQSIGRYILIDKVGVGGFSEVWKVKDELERNYALKIAEHSNHLELETEYHKAKDFIHPNLLTPLYYFREENYVCLVLPLCDHSLMDEIIHRKNNVIRNNSQSPLFSETEIALIIRDIADALIYLKKQGVVHKDIKPDNVMIYNQGSKVSYLVSDFGISEKHLVSQISRDTIIMEAKNKGITLAYASPEVHNNQVHSRSDIYSLGIIIYELITGELLTSNHNKLSGQLRYNEINKLIQGLNIPVAQRLISIILSCLKSEPKARISPELLMELSDNFLDKGYWSSLSNNQNTLFRKIAIYSIFLCTIILSFFLYNQYKFNSEIKKFVMKGDIDNAILYDEKNNSMNLFGTQSKLYDLLKECKSQSWTVQPISNELLMVKESSNRLSIFNFNGEKIINDSFSFINKISSDIFLGQLESKKEASCHYFYIINSEGKILNNLVESRDNNSLISGMLMLKNQNNNISIVDCNNIFHNINL